MEEENIANICDGQEVRTRIQNEIGVHDDLLTIMKKRKCRSSACMTKTFLQSEGKNKDEMGRQHQIMDRNGVLRFPVGSARQGNVEWYCYNVIGGAPTTAKIKRLR